MNKNMLKKSGLIVMVLTALMLVISWGSNAYADNTVTPDNRASAIIEADLRDVILTEGSGTYLVILEEQADLSAAYDIVDWEERGWYVYDTLLEVANRSQQDVLSILKTNPDVVDYQPHFILNAIHVTSGVATLDAIAVLPGIEAIEAEKTFTIPEPEITNGVLAPEWGVEIIRATEVWDNLNVFGAGVVLATIDTGVQYDHPALVDQYRGTATGSHDFNFFDPAGMCAGGVCDNNGHGTHVTGTMLGDDGGANQIGVAPEAIWIAAKGCESNSCSEASLLASAEWLLAPCEFGDAPGSASCDPDMRPHVINNSWGGGGGNPWYQASVDAWRAADIIPIFSAGNSGPTPGTIGSPSDYCNVMSIGGTNSTDGMYSSSSRGPGSFADCSDKPDISAPGQSVRSSVPTNSYATFSGTSMASPHVSGCVALMLSVAPMLDYDQIYDILITTAEDLGTPGFDYDYGHGRIDCYEAVLAAEVLAGPTGTLDGEVTADGSGDPLAGALIEATLNVTTTRTALTNAAGEYSMTFVPEGTYDVTASLFGYLPQTVSGVEVISGTVTTQDFALELAPSHTVSGVVTDGTTGWPLYASIQIDGAGVPPVWTDPADGSYSILLPEGITYTFNVNAWVGGYETYSRDIGPLTGDVTEDFGLQANLASCSAPGYSLSYLYFEDFQVDDGDYTLEQTGTNAAPWEWGAPVTWPGECPAGTNCWGTNLNGEYNNNAGESLISPVIDLSGVAPGEELTVRWYQANHIETFTWDKAYAEVSINGGPWTIMWQNPSSTVQEPWRELTYDISAAAGTDVQFRWRFTSDGSVSFAGLYVDRVAIAEGSACEPAEGGLVVGNVYDDNTGDPLVGAFVSSDDDTMITAATPADPNVDDGFYTIFAAAGSSDVTASMSGGYADATATLNITDGTTTNQDFNLAAGWLIPDPTAIEVEVELGSSDTVPLTLNNDGAAALNYSLQVETASEDFEGSFPPDGWEVINNGGTCVWQRNDAWPRDNYAGGDGFSAAADSDACGIGTTMNTELHSPVLDLSAAAVASLEFIASYNHLGSSSFRVHVSDDGGDTWTTELTWNADVDPFGPGEPVSIDLAPYLGSSNVIISFHYTAGWDWWVQVDQIRILTDSGPWLSLDPAAGSIDANDSATVDVSINTASLPAPGVYNTTISVSEDTPYMVAGIPVILTVTPPPGVAQLEGTVQSLGYCDDNPFAAAGAQVTITSGDDEWTVTADANGYYSIFLDEAYSPVDIEVTAPDHETGTATGVVLVGQQTTTEDFDLRWLQPCVSVDPQSFDVAVALDTVITYSLDIHNLGAAATGYAISTFGSTVMVELPASEATTAIGDVRQPLSGATPARSLSVPVGLNATGSYAVLLLTPDADISDLHATLSAFPALDVTTYAGNLATLTAAELAPYSVVMTTNNTQWDAVAVQVGNALADYVDLGGKVILNSFAYDYFGWELDGRFMTEEYGPFSGTSADFTGTSTLGTVHEPDHPIMAGVTTLSNTYLWQNPTLAPGAVRIADWNDGNMFLAANDHSVALNLLPSDGEGAAGWTGDLPTLYYNAIVWLAGEPEPIDWLYQQPLTGTVAADSTTTVDIIFDTTVLTQTGVYNAVMQVLTDDPMMSTISIPVTMTVGGAEAGVALDVTVSTDNECGTADSLDVTPGTTVYYCYTVVNTGNIILPHHTITDTVFGHIDTFIYDLRPGEVESVIYPQTITENTGSVASWTAENVDMGMSAFAEDTVTVTVSMLYLYLPIIAAP